MSDVNPTVRVRFRYLDRWAHQLSLGRGPASLPVKAAVKRLTSREMRHRLLQQNRRFVYTAPPAPDEEFMLELRRRFKPEVVAVSEYLKRDLAGLWGYDELG